MDDHPDEDTHAATAASRRSMLAVEASDREAWLAIWTDDAILQDPIGESILDPIGDGHRGAKAIAAFWDANIAPNQVRFDIVRAHAAGDEVANVGSIATTFPDGSTAVVDGVFCYRVGADGRLVSLRTYWGADDLRMEPAGT